MARADDRVTHNQAKAPTWKSAQHNCRRILYYYGVYHSRRARECECARGDRMLSFDRFKMDDGGVVEGG